MRRAACLPLFLPALLTAQGAMLDEGRLDQTWFGPAAVFKPSEDLGFVWVKPGLDLRHRTLWLKPWEPATWRKERRTSKDELLVARIEPRFVPELAKGLKRGLRGSLPVSLTEGDLVLVGRAVDAVGEAEDYLATRGSSLAIDLKLVDGDTGELLAAFHDTFQGPGADAVLLQYGKWCERVGRALAPAAVPLGAPTAVPGPPQASAPLPPPFDLEGALRRIEGLRRDGLLNEEEAVLLRKKATERAASKVK